MPHKSINIGSLRENYVKQALSEQDVLQNPFEQFQVWFQEAVQAQVKEPNAMTLATANAEGQPSARIVLLKEITSDGLVFFSNYESHKGNQLDINPKAALLFAWLDLERQVRIEGSVEKISTADSEAYFQSRPKGSQIGAWASPQSRVIVDRSVLESTQQELESAYAADEKLPLPPFWGGYIVRPQLFEFWQGRTSRLHDRICYQKSGVEWSVVRLAP